MYAALRLHGGFRQRKMSFHGFRGIRRTGWVGHIEVLLASEAIETRFPSYLAPTTLRFVRVQWSMFEAPGQDTVVYICLQLG